MVEHYLRVTYFCSISEMESTQIHDHQQKKRNKTNTNEGDNDRKVMPKKLAENRNAVFNQTTRKIVVFWYDDHISVVGIGCLCCDLSSQLCIEWNHILRNEWNHFFFWVWKQSDYRDHNNNSGNAATEMTTMCDEIVEDRDFSRIFINYLHFPHANINFDYSHNIDLRDGRRSGRAKANESEWENAR